MSIPFFPWIVTTAIVLSFMLYGWNGDRLFDEACDLDREPYGPPIHEVLMTYLVLSFCWLSVAFYRGRKLHREITCRKNAEVRALTLAHDDVLTGLMNRRAFMEAMERLIENNGMMFTLLLIDLDRFKLVNDLHGHAVGDALLVEASKRILGTIHSVDRLARIGGDEFVVILTSQAHPDKASLVASRIIEALRRPFQIEGHQIEIGASIGISLSPDDGTDAGALVRAADGAMYRAKQENRGAFRFFEASMNAQLQARLQLEQELGGAVERNELLLQYQPIVNAITGEVETFEALIRWSHPKRGMVPPIDFIPLAEETGLIDVIGRWVIDTACREAAGWPHPWPVSVNVSPRQFQQTDVCETIGDALKSSGLDPARIIVEVTEGVLIEDASKAVTILNRLRNMGLGLALDDFGTGYSSLSYLQLFKFDKFKIDRSFVSKLGQSDEALTIIHTVVNLGHNLGLRVTVEGVETEEQLNVLRFLGCDQIQGYLIARPAQINAFTDLEQVRTKLLFASAPLHPEGTRNFVCSCSPSWAPPVCTNVFGSGPDQDQNSTTAARATAEA